MFGVVEIVDPTWDFYAKNLRTGLFTGFLTISSFLLAMTTFVVMNLKAQYYDLEAYAERVKKRREVGCKRPYYRPLQNLGAALLASMCLTLAASLSQYTIGLYPSIWSVVVCATLSGLAFVALAFCLYQIWANMAALFAAWNELKDGKKTDAAASR